MKYRASWNGEILAESSEIKEIEGNKYFPQNSLNKQFFKETETHTTCSWKGKASYFNIDVAGKTNKMAAWYYPNPTPLAKEIKDYVAFWKGVEITEEG
ncbi:DUF427 domain-containing protein [Galbibacter orientalis]|uniref:DUF427 domain-containing protein n=1 Tax=Galbibacter orientalis DSM 19592 TaxID=926559 RepID=I3C3L0_9FLAO|nr:DUF427 domain-containing protein [Galbibacter orientalis]EIJ38203.1 hypothetical protein JoomaDRAFT_1184 [Galbibacter orientalis DSM 19592]|tara:strand:+ start:65 stop:358 length:294 start_codon:yes stop_codon:yes gene_type:complete